MDQTLRFSQLSPARQALVRYCQAVNFGDIREVRVRDQDVTEHEVDEHRRDAALHHATREASFPARIRCERHDHEAHRVRPGRVRDETSEQKPFDSEPHENADDEH